MSQKLATLAIVPARAGSKRLPRKNVRPLAGKPLVSWVLEAARAARTLDRVIVSSDDNEVLAIARGIDPGWPLERPAELALDHSPAIDYVRHALTTLEAVGEGPFAAVVILQPTSPFTTAADIDAAVELLNSTGADSVTSVMQLDHATHPVKMKRLEGDRLLPLWEEERGRMAAHELPEVYVRNCSVYATRRSSIERGQVIGDDCRGYVMPRERSLDINDELDFQFAEFLIARQLAASHVS